MRKLRIYPMNMFYILTFEGVEQVRYKLAQRQVKDRHEVHVYCCDPDKDNGLRIKNEVIERVHTHKLPYWFRLSFNPFIWLSLFWKLI